MLPHIFQRTSMLPHIFSMNVNVTSYIFSERECYLIYFQECQCYLIYFQWTSMLPHIFSMNVNVTSYIFSERERVPARGWRGRQSSATADQAAVWEEEPEIHGLSGLTAEKTGEIQQVGGTESSCSVLVNTALFKVDCNTMYHINHSRPLIPVGIDLILSVHMVGN